MIILRSLFEADEYGRITREAFYAGPNIGDTFEDLDMNHDGFITAEDFLILFRITGMPPHMYNPDITIDAVTRGDDEWLMENFFATSGWFLEHFTLRSTMEVLLELDLPIYIFHGTWDLNTYVGDVIQLYEQLIEMGKENIIVNIFPQHDHSLNWDWESPVFDGEIPDGIRAIFDAVFARLGL